MKGKKILIIGIIFLVILVAGLIIYGISLSSDKIATYQIQDATSGGVVDLSTCECWDIGEPEDCFSPCMDNPETFLEEHCIYQGYITENRISYDCGRYIIYHNL